MLDGLRQRHVPDTSHAPFAAAHVFASHKSCGVVIARASMENDTARSAPSNPGLGPHQLSPVGCCVPASESDRGFSSVFVTPTIHMDPPTGSDARDVHASVFEGPDASSVPTSFNSWVSISFKLHAASAFRW